MIHALNGVFFFFVVALPDDYAMQEAKMTILNRLQVLSHLPSNLRAEIDKLKEEVAVLAKQQAESLASNGKVNATIHKLMAENLAFSKECDILIVEKVALMKKCLEAFDGTISANHGREMALDALKNAIQKAMLTRSRCWRTRASWGMQCGFRLRPTKSRTAPPSDNQ
jgi:hypothetical protein